MLGTTTPVRHVARSRQFDKVARLGLAARAVIYILIGWVAILVATGDRGTEADQHGALQQVAHHTGGVIVLWVIAVGLAAYALWRFKEAVFGVAGEGDKKLPRIQSVFRGIVYAVLSYTCFNVIVASSSTNESNQQSLLAAKTMQHPAGRWLVGAVGVVILAIGIGLVVQAATRQFRKYLKGWEMSQTQYRITVTLGVIGTAARGLVFVLVGILVLEAAITFDPNDARGVDGALKALADRPYGPELLFVAAAGLMIFGLFGFAEARWRKT
jgi:hypothetical protein